MYFLEKLILLFEYCFKQFHQTKFLAYCLIIFCISLTFYYTLLLIKKSDHPLISNRLRRFFFVAADKSDSNAIQVGGIPFSIISILSIGMLFYWFPYLINQHQRDILYFASFSWAGIIVYGYIDDLFEIRPVVKLSFQFLMISIFCINTATIVFPTYSAHAFVVMLFLSVAILNGTNLMDGLDTLSYKVSSVIYFSFIVLAAPIVNLPALFIATSCFFIMTAFYFFNREPSKIHLGEVGVSCLGFSYIVLVVLTLDGYRSFNPLPYAITKAMLPAIFPLTELGVSFVRRILNGKSPFKGDKLHVHHILHEIFGLSASNTASVISFSYFVMMVIALALMNDFSSLFSFSFLLILSILWSVLIGWKFWFKGQLHINIFDSLLVKKDVRIISSSTLSDFRIIIDKKKKD